MSWHLFAVFFASTFFISATPGPNMLLAFQYGLNYGVKRTLWTLAGLSLGLFILLLSTLLGLDVTSWRDSASSNLMSDASELSTEVNKELNTTTEMADKPMPRSLSSAAVKAPPSDWLLFRTGMWVSLSNPKAILFFAAFFPKFINFSAPLWPQYIMLTCGLFLSETIWQLIYTIGGKKLAGWLDVGERLAWLNRGCGVIFILIAAALLAEVLNSFLS